MSKYWNYEKCWCDTCDIRDTCSEINYLGEHIPVICPMEITELFNIETEKRLRKGMHWIFEITYQQYFQWVKDQISKKCFNLLPPIF